MVLVVEAVELVVLELLVVELEVVVLSVVLELLVVVCVLLVLLVEELVVVCVVVVEELLVVVLEDVVVEDMEDISCRMDAHLLLAALQSVDEMVLCTSEGEDENPIFIGTSGRFFHLLMGFQED